jgi:hypothetical protein
MPPINCCTCRHLGLGTWNEPCATCIVRTPIFTDGVRWEPRIDAPREDAPAPAQEADP